MKKRYRDFNEEMRRIFGERIDKVTVNAGMTCPNIDGVKAKGGCTFCADASYEGLTLLKERVPLREQILNGMTYAKSRYPTKKFFVYFQSGTNTYAKPEVLRRFYEEALAVEGIVGIFLATRPDCLEPAIIDLLEEFHQRTYLWVELGIPSHRDDVNKRLNRAHGVQDFIEGSRRLSERGIRVCAHAIFGLPGESKEEVQDKADFFNESPIQGIKIHNLVVFKDTMLERQFHAGHYNPLELNDYASQCVAFVERLRSDMIIMRLNAHGPRRLTVAPEWSVNKMATLNAIHAEFEARQTWQGQLHARGSFGI